MISPVFGSALTCPRNASLRFAFDLRVCRASEWTVVPPASPSPAVDRAAGGAGARSSASRTSPLARRQRPPNLVALVRAGLLGAGLPAWAVLCPSTSSVGPRGLFFTAIPGACIVC